MDVLKVRRSSSAKLILKTDGAHFKNPFSYQRLPLPFSNKFSFIEYFVQLIMQLFGGSGVFLLCFSSSLHLHLTLNQLYSGPSLHSSGFTP